MLRGVQAGLTQEGESRPPAHHCLGGLLLTAAHWPQLPEMDSWPQAEATGQSRLAPG